MTTPSGEATANRSAVTFRERWLGFLRPERVSEPGWVNVWRWAVAVSSITSSVRSGRLATHLPLENAAWYALQFGSLALATLATLRSGRVGAVPRWPARCIALLVLCAAVSVFYAVDPRQVVLQVALLAAATVFLLSTYVLRWTDAQTRDVDFRCIFWVVAGIHLVGLVGYAAGGAAFVGDYNRYLGLMSNANYAGMTAALALTLAASSRRAIECWASFPC